MIVTGLILTISTGKEKNLFPRRVGCDSQACTQGGGIRPAKFQLFAKRGIKSEKDLETFFMQKKLPGCGGTCPHCGGTLPLFHEKNVSFIACKKKN